ncbi:metal-dependent hydrolase [Rhodobacterales bacterium HKCCE3408]|nr:metal-dependent hydrolase [Rhodobacterales bacterium HKCCE3408]
MRYTWLGHASVRLEIGDQVLLIDPWEGGPTFPKDRRAEAIRGATAILVTHGHNDHVMGVADLAKELGVKTYSMVELADMLGQDGVNTVGFNKGGTVGIGNVSVTMVAATHSSSYTHEDGIRTYTGGEVGYMIEGEGRCVYVSGDTDVMADMGIWNEIHAPDVGILCAGGFYTMNMKRAGFAAKRFFDFKTVIPYHYKTFPALEQNADALKAALPGVTVHDPDVMVPIDL